MRSEHTYTFDYGLGSARRPQYLRHVEGPAEVRTAELIAALSLATDLGTGLPMEHGLRSTVCAMRLVDRLGVDAETASQTFYGCLLFYVGCTADAEISAELFPDDALVRHFNPVIFGSPLETMTGIMRALAGSGPGPARALRVARRLPTAVRGHKAHIVALCEVAQMLTERLGLPAGVQRLFAHFTERWDGKGSRPGCPELRYHCRSASRRLHGTPRCSTCSAARSTPPRSSASEPGMRSTRRSPICWLRRPTRSCRWTSVPRCGRRRSKSNPALR